MSSDGRACHICEKYADSAAALAHLGNFGANFAERFMVCFAPTALHVYGEPSEEVRGVLDSFGAVYLGSFGGFVVAENYLREIVGWGRILEMVRRDMQDILDDVAAGLAKNLPGWNTGAV